MKLHLSSMLMAVLTLSACAPVNDYGRIDETITTDSQGIINGERVKERDTKASRSVVLFEALNSSGSVVSICTATLISNRSVLTAAHCLDKNKNPSLTGFRLAFTSSRTALGSTGEKRTGVKFVAHKDFKVTKVALTSDIAIGFFTGGIPEGYTISDYEKDPQADHKSKTVTVYGYGKTKEHGRGIIVGGAGKLHRTQLKIGTNFFAMPDQYEIFEKDNSSFICSGDSGGPQFLSENGIVKVIGVNSAVHGDKTWTGDIECKTKSTATKVGYFSPWIAEQHQLYKQ